MNPDLTNLDRLHDLIPPPQSSWWPPGPGWYWTAGIVFLLGLVFAFRILKSWQQNQYRREALAELSHPKTQPAQMAELLKRTALTAFSREKVAFLTGPDWFAFLDRSAGMKVFAQGSGSQLESLVYDPQAAGKLEEKQLLELETLVREWIRKHDPEFEQKKC